MTATILSAACVLLSSLGFSRDAVELNIPSAGSIISPDATFGVVNSNRGAAYVDFATGLTIARWPGTRVGDLSGDRRHFVTFAGSMVQYRYQASGALRFQFEFGAPVASVKFSPDSRFLWVQSDNSNIPDALYRVGSSVPLFTRVGSVAYSEDPRFAAADNPAGGATILRLSKGTSFAVPGMTFPGRVLAMSFSRREIVFWDAFDRTIRTIDFTTGQTRRLLASSTGQSGLPVAWYAGRNLHMILHFDGQPAATWDRIDLDSGRTTPISRFRSFPLVRVSADGSRLDVQEGGVQSNHAARKRWRRFLTANGAVESEYGGPTEVSFATAHHPTEPIAFYSTLGGTIAAVAADTGIHMWRSRTPTDRAANLLAISSDGARLAAAGQVSLFQSKPSVTVFDTATGAVALELDCGTNPDRIEFSKNGSELAVSGFSNGRTRIRVFNATTGTFLREHSGRIWGGYLGNGNLMIGHSGAKFWILNPDGSETPIPATTTALSAYQVVSNPTGRLINFTGYFPNGALRVCSLDVETGIVTESNYTPLSNIHLTCFAAGGEYFLAQSGGSFGLLKPRLGGPFVEIARTDIYAGSAGQKRVIWATASTISMARF